MRIPPGPDSNPAGLASESRASSFEEDGSWEFAANCGQHGLVGSGWVWKALPNLSKQHGCFVTKKIGWLENIT